MSLRRFSRQHQLGGACSREVLSIATGRQASPGGNYFAAPNAHTIRLAPHTGSARACYRGIYLTRAMVGFVVVRIPLRSVHLSVSYRRPCVGDPFSVCTCLSGGGCDKTRRCPCGVT